MKSINDFTDLSDSLKEEIILSDKGFINYNHTNYFYKRCTGDLYFRELIAYEIANFLNIPSIFYEPFLIPNQYNQFDYGVISHDYRQENLMFITGKQIIEDYNKDYLNKWFASKRKNNHEYNNLENIWNALDHRYRFMPNRNKIVEDLMNSIIKNIFLFDIFTKNADRHYSNWEIIENQKTNEIYLNSIYDNEDIFYKNYNISLLGCSIENKNDGNWYELLREFLILSDSEYLNLVQDIYNKLTPQNLIMIIELSEKRHNIEIPLTTKKDIISKYNEHYKKIGIILNEFLNKNKKIVLKS